MYPIDEQPMVEITITVPVPLAEFIQKSIESHRYMWCISHVNLERLGVIEHGRTIQDFPIGDIIPSLEIHKEQFTQKTLQAHLRGVTATMVGGVTIEKGLATPDAKLRIIKIETPDELVRRKAANIETPEADSNLDDEGWEAE